MRRWLWMWGMVWVWGGSFVWAEEGMLVFKTNPKDVNVYVDGQLKGKASELLTLSLPAGSYSIKIEKGDQSKEQKFTLPAAGLVKVEMSLEEKKEAKASGAVPFNFVRIEPGTFQMGSENGESDEHPVHSVTISKAFYLSDHEVTVGEYRKFVEATGYQAPGCNYEKKDREDHPVNCVSWDDTQAYISWLNTEAGKPLYRLPTEAEWEYAARAGTTTKWSCGDSDWCLTQVAWFDKNSGGETHPVRTKKPNYWKLYDMHGNVWEWVQDWYGSSYYAQSPSTDPQGPASGSYRVCRGGSWYNPAGVLRSADRGNFSPVDRSGVLGFRLLRME